MFADIVQIPAIKAHIFFPLFEPPTVNQKPTENSQDGQKLSITQYSNEKQNSTIKGRLQQWAVSVDVLICFLKSCLFPVHKLVSKDSLQPSTRQLKCLICTQVNFAE